MLQVPKEYQKTTTINGKDNKKIVVTKNIKGTFYTEEGFVPDLEAQKKIEDTCCFLDTLDFSFFEELREWKKRDLSELHKNKDRIKHEVPCHVYTMLRELNSRLSTKGIKIRVSLPKLLNWNAFMSASKNKNSSFVEYFAKEYLLISNAEDLKVFIAKYFILI